MDGGGEDEEKRVSPGDLQAVTFPLSGLGRRGYDEDHVRTFLQDVERELVTLLNEKVSLWNEVERLRRRIMGTKSSGVLFGREDAHIHAVRILSSAQLTADRYVADAQAYSHRLTEEARTRRDEILSEAQQHADMVLEEASSRAREAALATLNAPPVPPQMEADRSALKAELAYLRTFGEVYRTHLRAYTEGMLRSIADGERNEAGAIQQASAETGGTSAGGLIQRPR